MQCSSQSSRTTSLSSRLHDSVITCLLPNRDTKNLRSVVTNCIDRMEREFDRLFSSEDNKVWNAMESLLPSSPNFLNLNDLEPLFQYAMTIPPVKRRFLSETLGIVDLDAECRVYRRILRKEYDKGVFLHENHKKVDLNKVCAFMVKAHIDCTSPYNAISSRCNCWVCLSSRRMLIFRTDQGKCSSSKTASYKARV